MHNIYFLLVFVQPILSARILVIIPTPFYSHQSVFQPIWRELSLRGHQVTVITTNPVKNPALTNLTEIDLSFTYKLVYEDMQMQEVVNTEKSFLVLLKHSFVVTKNMTVEQLRHPPVQKLIESKDKFDLMIVEAHMRAWFGFAKKFNCPVIAVTSMTATNLNKRMMGNLNNAVFSHSPNLPFGKDLNLLQRVTAVIYELVEEFYDGFLLSFAQQRIAREVFKDNDIEIKEIFKNVSLFFTNEIPGFHKMTTNIPSVIKLNGLQMHAPQKLPEQLKKFMDEAIQGVIYFSLGSNVKSYLISPEKQAVLLETFKELPFRVIWKLEKELEELPPNVKILTWAPQQDILRHNNTKLFITQGGIQSIGEALRLQVPLLVLPFFLDQHYNGIRIKDLELGSWLNFESLTKNELKEAILEAVDNSTYLRNLEEMAYLLAPPISSLDKAIWWIEHVLEHGGAPHLRSPLADMPLYKYYLLDVILFVSVFSVIMIMLLRKLLKVLWAACSPSKQKFD